MDQVIRQIRRMAGRPLGTQTDEELLHQFFSGQDEDAFAALIRRHGAMVLGVCLRLLHHRQDAEDAFQATFLTLVRKGHHIRQRGALSSWLYRVAFRVALRLKGKSDRVSTEVLTEVARVDADPSEEVAWRELRPVLDTEVSRLPAKYRDPIILCYLEGKTYEEAAGELGCPKGTIAIRLLRGKILLKNRLARRGLALSAGVIAVSSAIPQVHAAVPSALQAVTANAAASLAAGKALSAAAPAAVAGLVRAVSQDIWIKKIQIALMLLLGFSLSSVGIGTAISSNSKHSAAATTEFARVTTIPKAEPPVTMPKPAKLESEPIVAKDFSKRSNRLSCLVIQFSIGLGCEDDADHLIRNLHRPFSGIMPALDEPHISGPAKHSASGLALRENLTDDELPHPAQKATERKTGASKTVVVYRFRFPNGDEIHVVIIDPA